MTTAAKANDDGTIEIFGKKYRMKVKLKGQKVSKGSAHVKAKSRTT